MLSVSNVDYAPPIRIFNEDGSLMGWLLEGKGSREGEDLQIGSQKPFNYTIIPLGSVGIKERLTFMYDGLSVKPSARSLRVYGTANLGKLVKALARCEDDDDIAQIESMLKEFPFAIAFRKKIVN